MWQEIENNLYIISSDKYRQDLPYLKLFIAIIVQAIKERDDLYFKSGKEKLGRSRNGFQRWMGNV